MSDIVLINCPITFDQALKTGDQTSEPPLGILYIAAYLKSRGVAVEVLDPAAQRLSLEDVLERLKESRPRIVGLSSLTSSLPAAVRLARAVKEALKDVTLGIGGPHVNVDPDFIHRFPVFDFQVVGEGEKVMLRLFEKLRKGESITGVHQGELVEDLDELPFPRTQQLDLRLYHPREPSAVMIGSRGCPFHCSFCSIPGFCHQVRLRSVKSIVDEMEAVYEECAGNYSFVDDCFTLNKKRTRDLCRQILQRGLKVRWMAMTRADTVDEPTLKLMAEAGCIELFYGIESGNEKIRKTVLHKVIADDEIISAVRLTRRHGIVASIFLMLGFPQEGPPEIEDTVHFGTRCGADTMGIHLTVPLPGSDLFDQALQEGLFDKNIVDRYARGELGEGFRNVWPAYVPPGLTKKDLVEAKKRAYRTFYLNPPWVFRRLWRDVRSLANFKKDLDLAGVFLHALIHGETKTAMS